MTDQDRPPPIELPLERYLEFFSAKSDRLMEAVRFAFYLCLVFASVFATSLIAVLTDASPSLLWILAMVLGITGAGWSISWPTSTIGAPTNSRKSAVKSLW